MFRLLPEDLVRLILEVYLGGLTDIAKLDSAVCNRAFRANFLLCASSANVDLLTTMLLKHLVPYFRWIRSRNMGRVGRDFVEHHGTLSIDGNSFDRLSAYVVATVTTIGPTDIHIYTPIQPVLDLDAIVRVIVTFPSLQSITVLGTDSKGRATNATSSLRSREAEEALQFKVELFWEKCPAIGPHGRARACSIELGHCCSQQQIRRLLILLSGTDVNVRRICSHDDFEIDAKTARCIGECCGEQLADWSIYHHVDDVSLLYALERCPNLTRFSAIASPIADNVISLLPYFCPKIVFLDLYSLYHITDDGMADMLNGFARLGLLKELSIGGDCDKLTEITLIKIAEVLPELTELSISGTITLVFPETVLDLILSRRLRCKRIGCHGTEWIKQQLEDKDFTPMPVFISCY